ncbi:protein O-fucosyltransferase 1 precursor [Strongylocentrotus purpuratus]|uniref:GDP-fucose protein O-fucosyltransferase 1 n=1 Tax=Strongylocentrotus purpuratus TaxID=7668 RepID=Q00P45_STRPU|nr:protein O-fucosyltransferase 1 precursor [Strongylocentrotus purpuratus]ABA29464.1 protein O-fucosyltransferase 1 [Strongylocentrotus purpuratus]|eukprot:NP_001091922.1 protein O-fucosyltransferase 1 precursor [Strongylocentrotus purpuratus]
MRLLLSLSSLVLSLTLSLCEDHLDSDFQSNEGLVVTDEREDGVFSAGGAGLEVSQAAPKLEWDPNGYFTFCPCMGRFGNQAEHYLGSLAFGKALNRTIILPPFRTYINIPFTDWFQFEPMLEFYPRLITMETFMEELAPMYWPESERRGYCWLYLNSDAQCEMKRGNPFGPFWDGFGINFAEEHKFEIFSHADLSNTQDMEKIKEHWDRSFPVKDHPVLALKGAPAPFPMRASNRVIQNYFKWNEGLFAEAKHHMDHLFNGEPYVGIHLRTGIDWERSCETVEGMRQMMASPQCHKVGQEPVTKAMCYPTKEMVLEETRAAVEKYKTKHVFIATDKFSYQKELKEMFGDEVKVHHLDPHMPQIDLIILGQSEFFIGNCVSSFTSFVKRERDGNGKPSTFWSIGV